LQLDALQKDGVAKGLIFTDKASGAIRECTRAGIAATRARGRKGGRPPMRPDEPKVVLAKKLYGDKTISLDDICTTLKKSKSTLYRHVAMNPETLAVRRRGSRAFPNWSLGTRGRGPLT
jgi:DNA invertase Pin-like site-specific DNA recombinase